MPYNYTELRPAVFTEIGQVTFLEIRDRTKKLLDTAGACRGQEMMAYSAGDSWLHLACIDRLVELGEIREVTKPGEVWGQYRVFVGAGR